MSIEAYLNQRRKERTNEILHRLTVQEDLYWQFFSLDKKPFLSSSKEEEKAHLSSWELGVVVERVKDIRRLLEMADCCSAKDALEKFIRLFKPEGKTKDKDEKRWKEQASEGLHGRERSVFDSLIVEIIDEESLKNSDLLLRRCREKIDLLDVYRSAWNGDQSAVEKFFSRNPTWKDQTGPYGTTLLYCSSRNNYFSLVRYLIERDPSSINLVNESRSSDPSNGCSALHACCYHGHLRLVQYLIQHGGDYFLLNGMNETPVRNAESRREIVQFFDGLLLPGWTDRTILDELAQTSSKTIEREGKWEYLSSDFLRWFRLSDDEAERITYSSLDEERYDLCRISLKDFSRRGKDRFEKEKINWIRSQDSSLSNIHSRSQWQLMFVTHPHSHSSTSKEFLPLTDPHPKLFSWYQCPEELNLSLERSVNYRRRYISLILPMLSKEKIFFDLENLQFFTRDGKTITGHLRWIPHSQPLNVDALRSPITDDQTEHDDHQLFQSTKVLFLSSHGHRKQQI